MSSNALDWLIESGLPPLWPGKAGQIIADRRPHGARPDSAAACVALMRRVRE